MFVNQIAFFMTILRRLKFGTAEMIKSQKATTLLEAIKQVKATYLKCGFLVTHILLDGQFKPLQGDAAGMGYGYHIEYRVSRQTCPRGQAIHPHR
jgi:hypothetical protein